MEHFKVDGKFIEEIYNKKKVKTDKNLIDGNYYHFYKHKIIDKKSKYENYKESTFFYPSGGIAFYDKGELTLVDKNKGISGFKGENPYQWAIIDALYKEDIELILLTGVAGSGKTFLSLGYALDQIKRDNRYLNIVLSRPKKDLSRPEGFLPGGERDKVKPYMMPFFDNARALGQTYPFNERVRKEDDTGGVVLLPLEKIKGRTFQDSFIIIDESEDLRYEEIVSILTRSDNSRLVICGDIAQIDDKTLDRNYTPLQYTTDKFKKQSFATDIYNPVTSRKGNVTRFVIDNFSKEEYENRTRN